jgi:predicted transcriptional regulator YheO
MSDALQAYVPVADAIALVLRPHVEVVVHDLASGAVRHIANPISRRQAGESSLTELEDVASLDQPVIGPYAKTNWDGRRLKSVSAVLNDAAGRPIGLFCINVDVSLFEALQAISRDFLRFAETSAKPSVLFQNDWREEANDIIGQFLADRGASLGALGAQDRLALVGMLDARGLFDLRNAAAYVARLLGLSRATLYKALKEARGRPAAQTGQAQAELRP